MVMLCSREYLPDSLSTKPTADTYGSMTLIFCSGVTISSCSPSRPNSSIPSQVAAEVADLLVGGLSWFELDVGVAVVVDPDERTVDRADPILDLVALLVEHCLEHCDFADGVLVERVLEFGFEPWQVVGDESVVQCAEPVQSIDRSVELERFLMPCIPEPRHRLLDAIGHGRPI